MRGCTQAQVYLFKQYFELRVDRDRGLYPWTGPQVTQTTNESASIQRATIHGGMDALTLLLLWTEGGHRQDGPS